MNMFKLEFFLANINENYLLKKYIKNNLMYY